MNRRDRRSSRLRDGSRVYARANLTHAGAEITRFARGDTFRQFGAVFLRIRPLFHQKEPRVKAHVMVAFLGYALRVTLKHLLKRRAPIVATTSAALVRYSATAFQPLITALDGERSPWLPGYRVKILDGNCIEASERRLKVLREVQAGALLGKSLVVYEPTLGLVSEVFPCEA